MHRFLRRFRCENVCLAPGKLLTKPQHIMKQEREKYYSSLSGRSETCHNMVSKTGDIQLNLALYFNRALCHFYRADQNHRYYTLGYYLCQNGVFLRPPGVRCRKSTLLGVKLPDFTVGSSIQCIIRGYILTVIGVYQA